MADVKFRPSALFRETFTKKAAENPGLEEQFQKFVETKSQDHMAPFGSKDTNLKGTGNFGTVIPKIRHAHLMNDLIVFYKLSGANPTLIDLYGIFTHDESGTGQPANIKRQKILAKKFSNQTFD